MIGFIPFSRKPKVFELNLGTYCATPWQELNYRYYIPYPNKTLFDAHITAYIYIRYNPQIGYYVDEQVQFCLILLRKEHCHISMYFRLNKKCVTYLCDLWCNPLVSVRSVCWRLRSGKILPGQHPTMDRCSHLWCVSKNRPMRWLIDHRPLPGRHSKYWEWFAGKLSCPQQDSCIWLKYAHSPTEEQIELGIYLFWKARRYTWFIKKGIWHNQLYTVKLPATTSFLLA